MVEYMSDQPGAHDMQLLFAKKRLYELQEAVRKYFTLRETKQGLCVDDMTSSEYTAYYEELLAARAAVDALVGEE
jgi:hypothetical protein